MKVLSLIIPVFLSGCMSADILSLPSDPQSSTSSIIAATVTAPIIGEELAVKVDGQPVHGRVESVQKYYSAAGLVCSGVVLIQANAKAPQGEPVGLIACETGSGLVWNRDILLGGAL